MPTGTKVDEVYQALLKKGYSKGQAARIAQAETGEALATGRPAKHPLKAANTAEAAVPPSAPKPRDRNGPEYALAAANDPRVDDLTTPSSTRVTPSPGQKVLQELRQDRVRRQAPEKIIDPLPDPRAPREAIGLASTTRKPRAKKPASTPAQPELPPGMTAVETPAAAAVAEPAAAAKEINYQRDWHHLSEAQKQDFRDRYKQLDKTAMARERAGEPTHAETREFLNRMGKLTKEAATRVDPAKRPAKEPTRAQSRHEEMRSYLGQLPDAGNQAAAEAVAKVEAEGPKRGEISKFILNHPIYKRHIERGDSPEEAAKAANIHTFRDHPVYQERVAQGASPEEAAKAAEADMTSTARSRVYTDQYRARVARQREDARMTQPSSTRVTPRVTPPQESSTESSTLRPVTSIEPDMQEQEQADFRRRGGSGRLAGE